MSSAKDYTIQAYIGYTDDHITVVRGRVLDDPAVVATQSDSGWTNLKNSNYVRMEAYKPLDDSFSSPHLGTQILS